MKILEILNFYINKEKTIYVYMNTHIYSMITCKTGISILTFCKISWWNHVWYILVSDLGSRHNMPDFGTRLVATYLGSWPGCSRHGRRQNYTGGPPFAFRVPPFFGAAVRYLLPRAAAITHIQSRMRRYGNVARMGAPTWLCIWWWQEEDKIERDREIVNIRKIA